MHTAGDHTRTACPENSTTTSTAITGVYECMCNAGYMDSSAHTICSSAKPCSKSGFCTFEYGGGEGLCLSCEDVPKNNMFGARCCSDSFPQGKIGPGIVGKLSFLSEEIVLACYAACGGTEPGPAGSSCSAATYGSGGGSGSGSGSSYYYPVWSPTRQGSPIVHLASSCISCYNSHTTHTTYG